MTRPSDQGSKIATIKDKKIGIITESLSIPHMYVDTITRDRQDIREYGVLDGLGYLEKFHIHEFMNSYKASNVAILNTHTNDPDLDKLNDCFLIVVSHHGNLELERNLARHCREQNILAIVDAAASG